MFKINIGENCCILKLLKITVLPCTQVCEVKNTKDKSCGSNKRKLQGNKR